MPPFVYAAEVPRSSHYRCWLDGVEHTVIDSLKGQIVRAAGEPKVEVEIESLEPIDSLVVRPLQRGIKAAMTGKRIRFTLDRHDNISIEINDHLDAPLFIFWDPPVETPENDGKTIIFKAGQIHEVGKMILGSGDRVFLEGGAVVRAWLLIENAVDVRVWGPGVLDQSKRDFRENTIYVRKSREVLLEDVLLLDTFSWSLHLSFSEDVRINRVRIIGWRPNCDGIDVLSSSHVAIRDCFFRNADDCVAIKSGKWDMDETGVMEDITVERCVFWNDLPGNAMEIGFELDNRLVQSVHFRDCDIIHVLLGAAFSIHNGGTARIEDVSFEDIRIEDLRDEFADLYVGLSIYSLDCPKEFFRTNPDRLPAPSERQETSSPDNQMQWILPLNQEESSLCAGGRGSVDKVRFHRIAFSGAPILIVLKGYDDKHTVSNVTFTEISCAGKPVKEWPVDMLRMSHARAVRFEGKTVSPD